MRSRQLVGRAGELATVRGLVDAAAGAGAAVLVAGEAGIGKSRLLREAADRAAAAGMVVLTGRAVEGGGTYRALAEAVFAHLRTTQIAESEELRPYRAALRRLLPGWAAGESERNRMIRNDHVRFGRRPSGKGPAQTGTSPDGPPHADASDQRGITSCGDSSTRLGAHLGDLRCWAANYPES